MSEDVPEYNEFKKTEKHMTYDEARYQILRNDYAKCAQERDEYKHQLNAANKEIELLKTNRIIL